MKRFMAIILILALLVCAVPAFAAGDVYYASTPIYDCSDSQLNNIALAANAINGWYVPCGSEFSFNDAVGPRAKEYGYVDATNGRGSHVMGGGVAQVAATLYLTLLQMPGINYTQITTYGKRYTGNYVSDGSLAVVTDYAAAVDFSFINYNDDMAIRFWDDGVYLYCEISTGGNSYASSGSSDGAMLGSASFYISGTSGLINNITRAADNANGVQLDRGEVFSFNNIVGPRTEACGFVSAVNGRGVNVIGGGVAQVASVLWLAVKDVDEITVVEKSTYGKRYNQDYVYSSEDAIVTDYGAGTDFAFRYDGDSFITVYVYVDGSYLCCDIYEGSGKENNTANFDFGGSNKSNANTPSFSGFGGVGTLGGGSGTDDSEPESSFGGLGGLGILGGGSKAEENEGVSGFGGLGGLGILGGDSDDDEGSNGGLGNIGGGLSW